MKTKEVLEQPNAGDAVNRRNLKRDAALFAVSEVKQLLLQLRLIQKKPLLAFGFAFDADAGTGVQLVEFFQPIGGENFVNGLATIAAKMFFVLGEIGIATRLPAMKTGHALFRMAFYVHANTCADIENYINGFAHNGSPISSSIELLR